MSTIRLRCGCGAEIEGDPQANTKTEYEFEVWHAKHAGCLKPAAPVRASGIKACASTLPFNADTIADELVQYVVNDFSFSILHTMAAERLQAAYERGRKDALK